MARDPELRRAIAAALSALDVDLGQLEAAFEHRDAAYAVEGLHADAFAESVRRRVVPLLASRFILAGEREARRGRVYLTGAALAKASGHFVRLGTSFNLTNPSVAGWAEAQGSKLIVEITERTRDSIRALVATAAREGGHPYELARQIRPLIGLHSRWATAVLRMQQRLTAEGVLSSEKIAAMTSRYYSSLLGTRAEAIARTETLAAENFGRAEAWQQAIAAGILSPDAQKEWVAAPDAEEVCAGLDGEVVGIDELFPGGEFDDVDMPPLHPNCRCTAVVISSAGEETGEELSA